MVCLVDNADVEPRHPPSFSLEPPVTLLALETLPKLVVPRVVPPMSGLPLPLSPPTPTHTLLPIPRDTWDVGPMDLLDS